MKILHSYEVRTLDLKTLFCADMTDGATWYSEAGEGVIRVTTDDLENGGFTSGDIWGVRKVNLPAAPVDLSQFIGHVNSFLNY